MFNSIFGKNAKAWTALITTAASYYIASQTGVPPEVAAPIVGAAFTWLIPNA